MEGSANALLQAVTSAISDVIGWVGTVIDAMLASDGALSELLPLFAIGIAISGIMLAIRVVRGFIWGA